MSFLQQSDEILSVSEFSRRFKMLVKTSVPELWISCEVSNLKTYQSGHTYFTLKDADASISAVLFKGNARAVSFPLKDGAKIFAFGEISLFEQRGTYQLIVRTALPDGTGDLSARFNALKKKLADEGLFDADRKKAIPQMPKNIAVITSPTGAAIRDFYRILKRRGWRGNIWILPSRVQGNEASAEIVSQLKFAQDYTFDDGSHFDVAIVMRGGGSLEDLWCFNEEIVARAVADCTIPTISAVGHEIDFTLSDFASDLRAETPSAAAEHISSAYVELTSNLRDTYDLISRQVEYRLATLSDRLNSCEDVLRLNSPTSKIANYELRLDQVSAQLDSRIMSAFHLAKNKLSQKAEAIASISPIHKIAILRERVSAQAKRLEILDVDSTLKRGFALATDKHGRTITASSISVGDNFDLRFADGNVSAEAKHIKQ